MKTQPPQISIELDNTAAEGTYSNLALIVHSPSEVIIDFARIMPGMPKGKVFARIIMTPPHAKMLLDTLQENIKNFESQFGKITVYGKESKNIGFASSEEEEK